MDTDNEKLTKHKVFVIITKMILFIAIGVLILCIISPIFAAKWYTNYGGVSRKIKGMYHEPENTIDIIMLGNSDMYNGISTMCLWNDTGITSYHIGTPMQTTWTSYYLLKDFLKTQSPKLVIIDVDYVFETTDRKEENLRQAVDSMKFSKNKWDLINDPVYNNSLETKISYVFPFFRYHSRWNELKIKDIEEGYGVYEVPFKGYELVQSIKPYKKGKRPNKDDKEINQIPENSKKYLEKIIELCKENNSDVLFVYIPTLDTWSQKKHDIFSKYAEEKNLPFIDYNLIDLDWKVVTRDQGRHLNVYGAEIITRKLEEQLKNYEFVDHRNDTKYEKWNEYYELYESLKLKK